MSLRTIFGIVLLIFCAACGGSSSEPPTAGETKDFASLCDKANEGKRVAVVGFLRFPEKFTGTSSVVLRVYAGGDYAGAPVGVQTRIGNQANQVELAPKEYTDKDLKVHTSDGQVAGYGTKVKVSGKVYYPLVGQDFKCALENPLIESAR
ncbi:MAG TPA: hypothetical protein VHS05_11925 [Pyrinomonadaceae bacterium]|jgi:hypothetical protein|nr:hypothetical protein [Pyrinomonadaceae bacterium]